MTASEQIIQVLDNIAEKMGIAVDWTADNVWPYVEQLCSRYICYEMATAIANVVICAIVTIIFWKMATHFHGKALEVEYDDGRAVSVFAVIFWIVLAISCIVLFFMTIGAVSTVITSLTFPEKIILDFVKSLLAAE